MSASHGPARREDLRLVTGRGRYAADMNLPGQLHAAFLRCDRAHAEIVSIDVKPALDRPGVVAAYTGADALAAGYTRFPNFTTVTDKHGAAIIKPERPVLAHGKVRFVGEPVAMLVAESALAAQDGLDAIEVEYRDLAPVVDALEALAPGAPQLHDTVPGNRPFQWEAGDANAVEAAFAQAAHVARVKVVSQRVVPSPMEPRACLVAYNDDGIYDIYVCSQGLNMMRGQFSALTGVPEARLRFHLHDNGGGFGQRSPVYPEYAALMIAAEKLRRPVKWVSTRYESFVSDTHGRGLTIEGELALDANARFRAARYRFVCDMGAYLTPTGSSSHVRNPSMCTTGVYRIPALHISFRLALTNTVPIAAYRGAGRPDIAYVVERLVDQAACDLGIDRIDLRRRNFIPPDAFPYRTPTLGVYEKADFAAVLDRALEASDWAGFAERRETSMRAGKLRGIGISNVIEATAPGVAPKDQVAIEVDGDGCFTVFATSLSQGQGHETTFADIVAGTLGVPSASVTLRESVHDRELIGNFSAGSRSLVGAGSVCKVAALKLIEKGLPLAAEALALEPSQVAFVEGAYRGRDEDRAITLQALARRLAGPHPHPLDTLGEASVGSTYPNGCHIAEVEIDPETGVSIIDRYTGIDDCGHVMNHTIVEGQIHGAIAQGAGQVFGEHAVYEPGTGQLLAGSFSDYFMPRAGFLPSAMHVGSVAVPSASNVLGAKGVGESGCTASIPALVSAVHDALRPLGVAHLDMPLTPCKVWQAIEEARSRTTGGGA